MQVLRVLMVSKTSPQLQKLNSISSIVVTHIAISSVNPTGVIGGIDDGTVLMKILMVLAICHHCLIIII